MKTSNEEKVTDEKIKEANEADRVSNNEFADHQEIIDIFLKWDRGF